MRFGDGVIERVDRDTKVRHKRRGSLDPEQLEAEIFCSTDIIVLPWDDDTVPLCPDCWPRKAKEAS